LSKITKMPDKGKWKSVVDPKSGKTYFYHTVTRETQWRKPSELASNEEKRKMDEKEAKQKDFFAAMEANILNSLSQGVLPGTGTETEVQRLASRKPSYREGRPALERTISAMDETVLQDLIRRQPSIHQPKKVESIKSIVSSLGGFESIVRQPSRLESVSEMFNDLPDEGNNLEDKAGDEGALNMSISSGFGLSWEETAALKKLGAIAKEMNDAGNGETADASKDIKVEGEDTSKIDVVPMPNAAIRAKSDGVFQKAKIIGSDFDFSDDDSDDEDKAVRPAVARRNTCGTIYMKTTMSAPDIDATIKCVCGVFRTHILTSEIVDAEAINEYEVFNDLQAGTTIKNTAPPSLDEVTTFYRDIFLKAQMESDCIIMSLIYVEKLIKKTRGALRPRAANWRSLIFSCMILSSKVWDDLSMWNADFSQSCPKGVSFPLQRINDLEINILNVLCFQVKVLASEYAKYYFLLRSMLIKSGLGGDEMTNPLDVEGARRLQQMSSQFESLSTGDAKTSFKGRNRAQSLNPNMFGNNKERKTLQKMGLEHVVEM